MPAARLTRMVLEIYVVSISVVAELSRRLLMASNDGNSKFSTNPSRGSEDQVDSFIEVVLTVTTCFVGESRRRVAVEVISPTEGGRKASITPIRTSTWLTRVLLPSLASGLMVCFARPTVANGIPSVTANSAWLRDDGNPGRGCDIPSQSFLKAQKKGDERVGFCGQRGKGLVTTA